MNYAMVCSDCDAVMDLIHGGNMMHKRTYHHCCPQCKQWTTLEVHDDEVIQ